MTKFILICENKKGKMTFIFMIYIKMKIISS